METRKITAADIKSYFDYSKEIENREATLYESGDQLGQEELKINEVVAEQNKIRFTQNKKDLFTEQAETVVRILAASFKDFGFEYNLYFDLVYNLLILEYERLDRLSHEPDVAHMLNEIGITDHIKNKVKALLDHKCGCGGN